MTDVKKNNFVAKVIINEIAPVYERVFDTNVRSFYRAHELTKWVGQLTDLYYNGVISKSVYREMLEWQCWLRRIASTGELKALKSYNDFCTKSAFFKSNAHQFDSALSEEELSYLNSL